MQKKCWMYNLSFEFCNNRKIFKQIIYFPRNWARGLAAMTAPLQASAKQGVDPRFEIDSIVPVCFVSQKLETKRKLGHEIPGGPTNSNQSTGYAQLTRKCAFNYIEFTDNNKQIFTL